MLENYNIKLTREELMILIPIKIHNICRGKTAKNKYFAAARLLCFKSGISMSQQKKRCNLD